MRPLVTLIILCFLLNLVDAQTETSEEADIATYQLGVVAETIPGSDLTYTLTVTNYGPIVVDSFYLVDGWSVNSAGISAFTFPIADPDFGDFSVVGSWEQARPDEHVFAWLLRGELAPGATVQFEWTVGIDAAYQGGLVNWAQSIVTGGLSGVWRARTAFSPNSPPVIETALDPDANNNRTPDGITIVTDTPTGEGIDLALYQTGVLTELKAGNPLDSLWLITNLGPQTVEQFYLVAGWSRNIDGASMLAQPFTEPDFGDFAVLGSWRLSRPDEDLWMWLLEGELPPGGSVGFSWERQLNPTYRGDLINWARVLVQTPPEGEWIARNETTTTPAALANTPDTVPDNDRSTDNLTTVIE